MAMTKKDFVAIAGIIRGNIESVAGENSNRIEEVAARRAAGMAVKIANDIADHCAKVNPEFKRGRFLEACGVA